MTESEEKLLVDWTLNQYREQKYVNMGRLQKQARKICENPWFHASYWWVRSFLNRHPFLKDIIRNPYNSKFAISSSSEMSEERSPE